MATKYFALLTNIGVAKLAKATALGAQVEITQMAVGDGNGALPTPNPAQTALTHEQRRAQLNMLTIDPVNTNQIIAEQVIPEDVGGWWIREVGLFDKDGDMIAVANCAETYKPQLQEGSGRVQVIRVILIVSSTEAVTLKIDPAVVLATRQYVDNKIIEVKSYADELMRTHEQSRNHPDATTSAKGFTQLNSSVTDDRETQSATPKAVKIAMDNANARLAKDRNLADLPNPALARQNLQLGDSSTKNTGTTANTVAAGDDARITGAMQKNQNGADIPDVAKFLQNLQLRESFSGVVGQSRNARMSVAAASATATFSADELIVEDSGGRQYRVTSFSKTINLATTGAGGMDKGVVPATGFVALYAIYNPTTDMSSLLAVNATSVDAPEIYSGSSLPPGYTASALVSVWGISESKFKAGKQHGRVINVDRQTAITTTATINTLTELSIAAIVPKNARKVSGYGSIYATAGGGAQSGGLIIDVASTNSGVGYVSIGGYVGNYGIGVYGQFAELLLSTPQSIFYDVNPNGTSITGFSASLFISGYTI